MNTNLATLADASSLILGYNRAKLSKIDSEPQPLPMQNPVPGKLSFLGETTRAKRNVVVSDAGSAFTMSRLESEQYPHYNVRICELDDMLLGTGSRWIGRQPVPVKK